MTAHVDSTPPAGDAPGPGGPPSRGSRRRRRRRPRRRPAPVPVGIDFGTDGSSLADFGRDGAPRVLRNALGRLSTPSAVDVSEDRLTLGRDLEETGFADDRGGPDGSGPVPMSGFKRTYQESGGVYRKGRAPMTAGGGKVSPTLLGAALLRGLTAETAAGRPADAPVVMTVPHAFTRTPRDAVRAAGRLAGLNVGETLSETTAAALAWLWKDVASDGQPHGKTRHALIYDLGAGTFDAAVVRTRRNELRVLAAEGDPRLGGRDWTERLAGDVADRFEKKHGFDPAHDWRTHRKLLGECEAAKLALSTAGRCDVPVRTARVSDAFEITRDRFEGLTAELLRRTRDLTEFLLENAAIRPDDLDVILPVGGAAAMPCVRRMLTDLFGPRASPDHAAAKAFQDPRTAVAEGAAVYAAMLRARAGADGDGRGPDVSKTVGRRLRAIDLQEVIAHSVGVEIEDPEHPGRRLNHVLLPRGGRLPDAVQMTFGTTVDSPQGIRLRLVEGERPEAGDCDRLGEYRITGLPPDLPARSPITVDIALDERNAPHVSAHRVMCDAEAAAAGAAHNLVPLTVEERPLSSRKEDAETRARLVRLMPHPR